MEHGIQNDDTDEITFFWPHVMRVSDGQISIKVTGYHDGWHWTGSRVLETVQDPFGLWFFRNRFIFPPLMEDHRVEHLRKFWAEEIPVKVEEQMLRPLADGNYLFRDTKTSESEAGIQSLFKHFGESSFTSLTDIEPITTTVKFLIGFCKGNHAIICFRKGRCDLFIKLDKPFSAFDPLYRILKRHKASTLVGP